MSETQVQTNTVTITEAAAQAVKDLLEKREMEDHALRLFIAGGGCGGYQYGMALENDPRDTDTIFEQLGVKLVVDEMSINYLSGANIDYVDDVMGSGFKIENPNAVSSCGCGSSFTTKDQSGAEGGGGCGSGGCG